jgi:Na+-transporting NADH:ubiquinone oxidoreductase subunit NqrC
MEQSAFEAVMTGVYVFVFVIALSAGILLMTNVLDMVNFANERAIVGMNGTLAETVGIVEERVYTGAQMLTYYREQIQAQEANKDEQNYEFNVKLSKQGQEKKLASYIESESMKNYLSQEFILQYKGNVGGKHTYVFLKK